MRTRTILAAFCIGACALTAIFAGSYLASIAVASREKFDANHNLELFRTASIPFYPGSTLNREITEENGRTCMLMSALTRRKAVINVVTVDVPASVIVVRRWYGEKLPLLGFEEEKTHEQIIIGASTSQVQWSRGQERLFTQYAEQDTNRKLSTVTLARVIKATKEASK